MTQPDKSNTDSGVDHVRRLFEFAEKLKAAPDRGMPLTRFERSTLHEILRLAVLDTLKIIKAKVEADPEAYQ